MKLSVKSMLDNRICLYALWIPFLKPSYLSEVPQLDMFFDIWKVVAALWVLALCFMKGKISKMLAFIMAYQVISILITIARGSGDFRNLFMYHVPALCMCMLIELCINVNFHLSLSVLQRLFEILLTLNLITILQYPNGMPNSAGAYCLWLLGYKNYQIITVLPAVTLSLLYSCGDFKKKIGGLTLRTCYIIIISMLTCYYNTSTTSLIAMACFVVFLLFPWKPDWIFNIYNYIVATCALFFGLVIFQVQQYMGEIIEKVFHKSATFTGRVLLWERYIELIWEHVIFGHGNTSVQERAAETSISWSVHAHNQFLEILYEGGIVLFLLFVIIIMIFSKRLFQCRSSQGGKYLGFSIMVLFILFQTEVYAQTPLVFMLFVLAYYMPELEAQFVIFQEKEWKRPKIKIRWGSGGMLDGSNKTGIS